jgi:hypothetical protein
MTAMTKNAIRLMTAAAGFALLSGPVLAEDADRTGTNRSAESTAATTPQAAGVEKAKLSADLAAYARQSSNPVAMLLAAQLESEVGGSETPREKMSEPTGEAHAGDSAAKTERPRATADTLFAEARTLARGDSELIARIDRTAQRQSKGRVPGPARHVDRVDARTNDWYTIPFRGGEQARLAVVGDGDTDLDLYVYDENGNLVCSDTDYTDRLVCAWNPVWTGNFRVKISNLGRVYNEYVLLTN